MSTLNATDLTIGNVAKRLDPDGKVADIAEVIAQTNELFEDIPLVEANGHTYHRSTIRNGLPSGTFRAANEGVANEKSSTIQVDDVIAELATYSEIDQTVADTGDNTQAVLASENVAFQQGLAETMASKVFYGNNDTNHKEFHGLDPRFNSLSGSDNSDNVIDGNNGGSGSDSASIWLVGWSPNTVFGTYPQGSMAGLEMDFKGLDTVKDASGNQFEAYRTFYRWRMGLTVKDWRYVVRICNIDTSELTADKSSNSADLTDLIAQALELMPSMAGISPRFYMNRKISSFLRRQRNNTTNVQFGTDEVFGRHVMTIDGVPVKRIDALTNTEADIS